MSQMSNAKLEHIRHRISFCNNLTILLKCFYYGNPIISACARQRFEYLAQEIEDFRDSETIAKKLKSSLI